MSQAYSKVADDFFVEMHLNTEMELPSNRDTVSYTHLTLPTIYSV